MDKLLFWRRTKVPVIVLNGLIAARAGSINIAAYTSVIGKAFEMAEKSGQLVLAIESPGGSAVQSDLIGQLIRRRATEHEVKVTAVIGDVGASGGYWLACAADRIVANRLSIVGSIGVITGGFGLDRFLARYDIDRRLFTAGENKARLETFSPLRPQDAAFTAELLADAHEMFKSWVRERRGGRLTASEDQVFDGGYMLGEKAKALGLVDELGDLDAVITELGGETARPVYLRPRRPRGLLRFLAGGAGEALLELAERRLFTPSLR